MNDDEIIQIMIPKIEEIVKEKAREDFNETKVSDRKAVAKIIIKELNAVMDHEN